MAQKPETVFRQKFRAKLDKIPNCWFESIQQKSISGTPDLLGCVNGFFVGLELKSTDEEKASKLQELKLARIAQAGGMGLLVSPGNADAAIEIIKHLAKEKKNA